MSAVLNTILSFLLIWVHTYISNQEILQL